MIDLFFFVHDFFAWPTLVRKFSYHIFTCLLDPGLTSTTRWPYYLVLTSTYLRLARFRSSSLPECQVARIALIRDYLAIIFFFAPQAPVRPRSMNGPSRPGRHMHIWYHEPGTTYYQVLPGTRYQVPGSLPGTTYQVPSAKFRRTLQKFDFAYIELW